MMGIMELRRNLGERIEAAYFRSEPTIVRHEKKNQPRAVLISHDWWLILEQELKARGIRVPPAASDPSDTLS